MFPRLTLLALALACALVPAASAGAQTTPLVVTSTADTTDGDGCTAGHCTLREAILAAEGDGQADTVEFDIPGAGPHVIEVLEDNGLPYSSEALTIDGLSQDGAAANTAAAGWNGDLRIEIRGRDAGDQILNGMWLMGAGSLLRGVAVNGFAQNINAGGAGTRIENVLLGFTANGTPRADRTAFGLIVDNGVTVGGDAPGQRNVLTGTSTAISVGGTVRSDVIGNYIGTNTDGTAVAGSSRGISAVGPVRVAGNVIATPPYGAAIGIFGSDLAATVEDNIIGLDRTATSAVGGQPDDAGVRVWSVSGSTVRVAGNLIRGRDGVHVQNTAAEIVDNRIVSGTDFSFTTGIVLQGTTGLMSRNRISGFGRLAIDVGADGATPAGRPVLTEAVLTGGGARVAGTLNAAPDTRYDIELFADGPDVEAAQAQAAEYLERVEVTTDATGAAAFSTTRDLDVQRGHLVTATATALPAVGRPSTSELSPAVAVTAPPAITGFEFLDGATQAYDDAPTRLAAQVSNPGGLALTFDWDCNGDTDFADAGDVTGATSAEIPCIFPTAGTHTIDARVTNADGSDTVSPTITVVDAPPVVELTSPPAAAVEGATRTYAYTVSPASATVVERCGTGGVRVDTPAPQSFDCRFPDGPATSSVSVTATDDGVDGTDAQTVAVSNVAPAVDLTGPATADEGQLRTYTWTVTDPGDEDFSGAVESCGPGATYVPDPEARSFGCRFGEGPATSAARVRVDDGDATAEDSVAVTVADVAAKDGGGSGGGGGSTTTTPGTTPPSPPPAPRPTGFAPGAPVNAGLAVGARLSRGRLLVRVRNANPFAVTARVELLLPAARGASAAAKRRLATATLRLGAGATGVVRLRLDARTRARLRRGAKVRRVLRLRLRDAAGATRTVTRTITVPRR